MESKFSFIPAGRQKKILEYVEEHGSVQVKELSEYLGVSEATVRRDLDELDSTELLQRTHGGAIQNTNKTSTFEMQYSERIELMQDEKKRIAKKAASFIREGDTILLDTGTTCYYLSNELSEIPNLTIITYDLFIANNMVLHPTSTMIVTGGIRRQGFSNVLLGDMVEDCIRKMHVDKVFLGADAIDLDFGVSNTNILEASVKRLLLKAGKKVILIADHTKLNDVALVKVCDLTDIDELIMDNSVSEKEINYIKEKIQHIHLA